MSNINEAIANCRVSTEEQMKTNNSLNRQRSAVEELAKTLNVKLVKVWSGSVSSKVGRNVERKDLDEMLEYCKKHRKVKYAIFDEPDRFMRSMFEMGHFYVKFEQLGVSIRFASKTELEAKTAVDKLLVMLEAFKAEGSNEERINKSINGGRKAIREGRYPYSTKLGYMRGEKAGIHILNPEPAEILRNILIRLAGGFLELSESLAEFNKSSYTTSGKHHAFRIDKWKIVVTDPYYCGIIEVKRQINERNENGLHEPLITKEQHRRIVEIVEGKVKRHSGPRKNGNPEFPLSTILLCEKCTEEEAAIGRENRSNRGKFVGSSSSNGKTNKRYNKYKCRKCGVLVNRDEIHEEVNGILGGLELTSVGRNKLIKALQKVWGSEDENNASEIVGLKNQLANVRKVMDEMTEKLCVLSNPTAIKAVEDKIEQKSEEIEQLADKIRRLEDSKDESKGRFMKFALEFADNLGSRFLDLSPDNIKKCKQLLFPVGFFVNPDKKVYTPKISPFYRGRTPKDGLKSDKKSLLVIPSGIEPLLSG